MDLTAVAKPVQNQCLRCLWTPVSLCLLEIVVVLKLQGVVPPVIKMTFFSAAMFLFVVVNLNEDMCSCQPYICVPLYSYKSGDFIYNT